MVSGIKTQANKRMAKKATQEEKAAAEEGLRPGPVRRSLVTAMRPRPTARSAARTHQDA